jgi:hypothetical protein
MSKEGSDDLAEIGQLAKELLGEFVGQATAGQLQATADAAKRVIRSDRAAPVRQLVRDVDDANGQIFSRALLALLEHGRRKSGP